MSHDVVRGFRDKQLMKERVKAAGLRVTEGYIKKALRARVMRDDVIIYTGSIASLRRFKEDVAEVKVGLECGITLADSSDVKAGDILLAHLGIWSRQDPWAPAVLEPLITGLKARGLCFATLREHPVLGKAASRSAP
jgi:peptidoglycan/xylan/chitin deacetylase (PgdA/CDA1 family)